MGELRFHDYSLYLVMSSEYAAGRPVLEIAKSAIAAGVDIIQLREKNRDKNELINLACEVRQLCHKKNVIFIINDDPHIAVACGADGVHLGQEDLSRLPLKEVRNIIGRGKIIGVSTHSLDEVRKANSADIDYIAYGPVFATQTKKYFLGTKDVKAVLSLSKKPVVLIGGINLSNMDEVLGFGAKNIAVIRGILQAEDIESCTRDFKNKIILRNVQR